LAACIAITYAIQRRWHLCTQLFQAKYGKDAHRIRVSQGDGGIDVLVGDFSKAIDVYQCKCFIDGVGEPQQ